MTRKNICLFGTRHMAEEYLKVLNHFRARVCVIGRNERCAVALAKKYNQEGFGHGTHALKKIETKNIDWAIIASSVDSLKDITLTCLRSGIKKILIEKPGALNLKELREIQKEKNDVDIRIAYNRRFYNSVLELKKRIQREKGALGCFFDFTDREKDILNSSKSRNVMKRWGFANSSHVIDTAFDLIGLPEKKDFHSLRAGSWVSHPKGNAFVGCGRTRKCPFAYFATWAGGGRWNIEVSTKEGRYKLSPLEELMFCKKNQFTWEKIHPQDNDDNRFKPGLYKMITSVLTGKNLNNLPNLDQQIELCKIVNRIFGYED